MVSGPRQIFVRRLDVGDADIFKQLRLESLRKEPHNFFHRYEDEIDFTGKQWVDSLQNIAVFAAFCDNVAVGIMGLIWHLETAEAHHATLVMVYVQKSMRGSGIASLLLREVIKVANIEGITQLELLVSAENPAAERFYCKEGFVEIDRISGARKYLDREIDEIKMVLSMASAEN